jgi:hypothetical protein
VFGRSNKIDSGKRLCHSSDSQPNEVTTLSGETVFHYKIHWEEEMTREYPALGTLVLLAFFSLATPGYAQTAAATTKSTVPLRYDVSKEVTLNATVESVPGKSSDARTQGDFLVLQTKSGSINGGLTPFALNEKGGISISAGQQVKVTGLMMTIQNKQVFLIRTLEVDGRTYELRSKRGAPLEHPARNGASSTQSKGGQL